MKFFGYFLKEFFYQIPIKFEIISFPPIINQT